MVSASCLMEGVKNVSSIISVSVKVTIAERFDRMEVLQERVKSMVALLARVEDFLQLLADAFRVCHFAVALQNV